MNDGSGHWDKELFRREGHRMVDWIAEYLDGGNRKHSVLSRVEPCEVAGRLTGPRTKSTAAILNVEYEGFLDEAQEALHLLEAFSS